MYCDDLNTEDFDILVNKEPKKCYGWFWIDLENLKKLEEHLFLPLKQFFSKFPKLNKIKDLKLMVKNNKLDDLFDKNIDFEDYSNKAVTFRSTNS